MSLYLRLFGHAFFTDLGLGAGSGLFPGVSFALTAVFFVSNDPLFILLPADCVPLQLLYKFGHVLRARSSFAHSE
jgi:MFS transporter, DHA1 family, multidrug resistance protein